MNDSKKNKPKRHLKYIFLLGFVFCLCGIFLFRAEILSYGHGRIEAKKHTVIFSPETGSIQEIHVKPGQKVERGEKLLVLQNSTILDELKQLEFDLLHVNKQLESNFHQEETAKIKGFIPQLYKIEQRKGLRNQKEKALNEIQGIYSNLAKNKLVSEITFLTNQIKELEAQETGLSLEQQLEWKNQNLEQVKHAELLGERDILTQKRALIQNEIDRKRAQIEALTIHAPYSGIITETYMQYESEWAKQGQPLVRIDNTSEGFRVIAQIDEKNIDLIQKDMPVRMKSKVFKSEIVGYIHGKVDRVIRTASYNQMQNTNNNLFEIWIELISYPNGEPVPATGVEVEVIIGKENLIHSLIGRPKRQGS